ncbi:MAG: GGDEF domain-containing protein [Spirochaetia bacterium]|nr:GGDEF domain-containing protein [Spirochaetia bacterium]
MLLSGFSLSAYAAPSGHDLRVQEGSISLSGSPSSVVLALSGEWNFLPGQLVRSQSDSKNWTRLRVPGEWSRAVSPENGLELGTYALSIHGLEPGTMYAVHLGEIGAVARVFANGRFIGKTGELNPEHGGPEISFARPIYSFNARQGINEITVQVANGDLAVGGIWQNILFGTADTLYQHRLLRSALEMFFIGGIFLLGMYYFWVYLLWPGQHSSMLLALYSFLVALKSVFSGQQILFTAIPSIPDVLVIRLAHLATVVAVPVLLQFFRYLYPGITGKTGIRLSCSVALLQSLIIVFFPPHVFQVTAFMYHGVITLHVPYVAWIFYRARKRGDSGVPIGVIGFAVLLLTGTNDILHDQGVIQTTYMWNIGFFCFLFAQSILQAYRFRTINEESERVKLNLKQAVAKRTAQLTRERNKLSQIAKTDGLTGLHNRRYGMEQLQKELNRVRRYGGCMVVALIDIDNFKVINDTHGHLAGDKVLTRIGTLFTEELRKVDFSARWGGEEFLLFFPNTDLENGKIVLEKLRESFSSHIFHSKSEPFTVSFSYGLSDFNGGKEGIEEVLQHCDYALYHAKETGRNRGAIYSEALQPITSLERQS